MPANVVTRTQLHHASGHDPHENWTRTSHSMSTGLAQQIKRLTTVGALKRDESACSQAILHYLLWAVPRIAVGEEECRSRDAGFF
ncbi:hypothetical protein [Bradyrhizobium sp. STM 3566]|uniref:hypothetical protein n=1 Tax=Bradyrhizobium sp. STM 3566 TaxID=578928 RepID=UPI00388DE176